MTASEYMYRFAIVFDPGRVPPGARVAPGVCVEEGSRETDLVPVRTCRVCGCTDARACPGGCWWIEPDLCSRCAEGAADVHQGDDVLDGQQGWWP